MKIHIIENGVSLVPETDFEKEFLSQTFALRRREVVLATGISAADVQELRIRSTAKWA